MQVTGEKAVIDELRHRIRTRAIRLVLEDNGIDPDELLNDTGESRLDRYLRKLS